MLGLSERKQSEHVVELAYIANDSRAVLSAGRRGDVRSYKSDLRCRGRQISVFSYSGLLAKVILLLSVHSPLLQLAEGGKE